MTRLEERPSWRRDDLLHRRAIRAAAAAALLGGGLACGPSAELPPLDEASPTPDAGMAASVTPVDAAIVVDAGAPVDLGAWVADAGGADAGMEADAGVCEPGPGWAECCIAIGWDADRGCSAWGPPAPPPFGGVA